MSLVTSKTAARIAAIQALYQYESNGRVQDLNELCDSIVSSYNDQSFKEIFDIPEEVNISLHKNHFRYLTEFTINNLKSIDKLISDNLHGNWKFSNLHLSLSSLLRVAIAEIIYCQDVPTKVILNEYTNIGSSLAKESEIAFINSLLDKLAKEKRS